MSQILLNSAFELKKLPFELKELIELSINNDSICSTIIILPTGKQVRYLTQQIIKEYYERHSKPISELKVFTLENFLLNLSNSIYPNKDIRIISEAYRLAIIEEATEKVGLKFFKFSDKPLHYNVIKRLANIIYGLKEDGITLDSFRNDIKQAEELNLQGYDLLKLKDILKLYEYYQNSLGTAFVDFAELIAKLIEHFNSNDDVIKQLEDIYKEKKFIFINGFSEFKNPEIEIISKLNRINIPVAISIDYSTENGPLFGNLEDTIIKLVDSGYKLVDKTKYRKAFQLEKINAEKESRSEYLRSNLFYAKDYKSNKTDEFNDIILICEAKDRQDEVQSIARLIKHHIINKKNTPSDICIAMRQPQLYSMLFREQLTRYKIPFNISDRFELSNSAVIISIFSILNLIVYGYKRDDLHQILSSNYLPFYGDNSEAIDSNNLLNVAYKLRILGGMKRGGVKLWERRFEEAIKAKEMKLFDMKKGEQIEIERIKSDLKTYQKAYLDFNVIKNKLSFIKQVLTAQEFYELITKGIIKQFNIYEIIEKSYEDIIIQTKGDELRRNLLIENLEKDSRSIAAFIRLLDEFVYIWEDRFKGKSHKLSDFVGKLKTVTIGERYQIHEKPGYGVNITSIEQTRGIPYRVIILCGAIDGEFPINYRPEYFLGKELPEAEDKHHKSERIQFYQFLTNSKELLDSGQQKIYIFYPKYDRTKELVCSPFVNALLKITTIEENNRYIKLEAFRNNKQILGLDSITKNELGWIDAIAAPFETYKHFASQFIQKSENLSDLKKKYIKFTDKLDNIEYIEDILRTLLSDEYTNGILDISKLPKEILEKLKNAKEKAYSITELETYSSCPFKYFMNYMLEIEEKEVRELGLHPKEKGNLLHIILYRFYTDLQKHANEGKSSNSALSILSDNNFPIKQVILEPKHKQSYLTMINRIAEEEIEQIRFDHPFFDIEIESLLGNERKRGHLEIWLDNELKKIEDGWKFQPGLFEFSFGMSSMSQKNIKSSFVEINGLRIRGKIDRVEFLDQDNELYFLIADYKLNLNNVASNTDIAKGFSFQVPLYLLAAKEILGFNLKRELNLAGGVYYSLIQKYNYRSKTYESRKFVLLPLTSDLSRFVSRRATNQYINNSEEMYSFLEDSLRMAKTIVSYISEGYFPVMPQNTACDYCQYNSICRYRN